MDNQDPPRWYFKTWSLIVSFLCIGPFMLPLVWTNPRFSKNTKIIISAVVIFLTYLLSVVLVKSLQSIGSYYQLLSS
jgi:purine-cytosine permease-like protein